MGVQATMTIGDKKGASAVTINDGEATYPGAGNVSLVAMVAPQDQHRLADIERALQIVIDYARDNNLYRTAGGVAIVTTLDGGKDGVTLKPIAAEVVLGDIGMMLTGSVRNKGARNITDNAHRQLIDWMRENKRLAS